MERLTDIASWLKEHELGEGCMPELRQSYPDVHFTWCMDDDIGCEEPVLEEEDFNLYLVDGNDHCLKFTRDPAAATGVVVAEITGDD